MRLLIVEDEEKLALSIKKGLQESLHAADVSHNGEDALFMARQEHYDAIILDLMIPGIDGLTVLQRLRAEGNTTAVLILTAVNSVEDRVKGLKMGADDYLCKPFAFSELLARIESIGRRQRGQVQQNLSYEDLEMNLITRTVQRAGRAIELRPKEFSILKYFLEHHDQMITRTMISESVWDYSYDVGSNVIDVHIKRVREKINSDGLKPLIKTVKGVGYRLY